MARPCCSQFIYGRIDDPDLVAHLRTHATPDQRDAIDAAQAEMRAAGERLHRLLNRVLMP